MCHSALLKCTMGTPGWIVELERNMSSYYVGAFKSFVSYLHKVVFLRHWVARG